MKIPFLTSHFLPIKKDMNCFRSYLPKKLSVFGLEKANQDIYNASFLDELLEKTVITKSFEEVVGRRFIKFTRGPALLTRQKKKFI